MKTRVLIGLREVAGYGGNLKKGFDALGVDSVFLSLSHHSFRYDEGRNPAWARRANRLAQSLGKRFVGNWILRILWVGFLQNLLAAPLFLHALLTRDTFIFISVSSFFFFLDLPILKLFGKRIIFVFVGSDTRPAYLNGYVIPGSARKQVATGIALAWIQKTIVSIVERFADVIVNIPPQSHFHSRPIVSGFRIGMPVLLPSEATSVGSAGGKVRVLHAPSKPGPKGSRIIRETVARLVAEGVPIDYVEITGRPNSEVLDEIRRSDFVIDELYSDTPMAGFATEAAFFGKPAIVGSYFHEGIREYLSDELMPPSLFCSPAELRGAILRLVEDIEFRKDLGSRAREFIRAQWRADIVAERFLRLASGDIPKEWFFDPGRIRYVHGCGLPEELAREIVGNSLALGGPGSLRLSDKPELLKRLETFASTPARADPVRAP